MINIELHKYKIKAVDIGKEETNLWFAGDEILYVEFLKEQLREKFSLSVNVQNGSWVKFIYI